MILINENISIDDAELTFQASRSSGPGGQNVNKVSTRITLRFDLERSTSLNAHQKALIRRRLSNRINKDGILSVSAQRERSQSANREAATERFGELLRKALQVNPERRRRGTPARSKRRRLEKKRRRSRLKQERSRPSASDD